MIPVREQGFYHPFNPDNPNSVFAQNKRAAEEQAQRERALRAQNGPMTGGGIILLFVAIVTFLIFTSRQFDMAIPMIVMLVGEPLIGIALFVFGFRFLRSLFRRARAG
ncbi:hypothetical protein [Acidiphilium acidophilum]|uniref:hypothetical protein n=1 Tax=Acidiphilium acidophilum TaxID=76588 RepID=UPI002E8E785C|nr:hypothetical protein [Acidiphilium acidophilum]